jgi:hypothetical protein
MAYSSPRLAGNQQVQQTELLADVGTPGVDTLSPLDSHLIIVSPETRLTTILKSNHTTLSVKPSNEPKQADSVSYSKETQEPSHSKSGQPTVATLTQFGIKVIDFAYVTDSTLTTPKRVPQQHVVGVRPPKRLRKVQDVGDAHSLKKPRSLERQVTEPVIGVPLRRSRAYTDIRLANWVRDDTIHGPMASNFDAPAPPPSPDTFQGVVPQVDHKSTPNHRKDHGILLSTPRTDGTSQDSSYPISASPRTPPRLSTFSYLLSDVSPPALSYSQSQGTSQSQPYVTTPPLSRHGSERRPWPIIDTSPVVTSQQQQGLEFPPQGHVIDPRNLEGFEIQTSPLLSTKPAPPRADDVSETFDRPVSSTSTTPSTPSKSMSFSGEQPLQRYPLRKRSALAPSPPRPSTRGVSRQMSQLSLGKQSTHAPAHKRQRTPATLNGGGSRGKPRSRKIREGERNQGIVS